MSQAVDPSTIIADTIAQRDKLLKLAEISPTKNNGSSGGSGKKQKHSKSFLPIAINSSRGSKGSGKVDLSFTEDIGHLVNNKADVVSPSKRPEVTSPSCINTNSTKTSSCDQPCECQIHAAALADLHLDQSESPSLLERDEIKTRIPQLKPGNTGNSGIDPPNSLDAQSKPSSSNNNTNPSVSLHNLDNGATQRVHSFTTTATSSGDTNHTGAGLSHIPIFRSNKLSKQGSFPLTQDADFFTNRFGRMESDLFNSSSPFTTNVDDAFFRLEPRKFREQMRADFVNFVNSSRNQMLAHSWRKTSPTASKIAKSRSNNALSHQLRDANKRISSRLSPDDLITNFLERSADMANDFNQRLESTNSVFKPMGTFVAIDEDSFINSSPKRIINRTNVFGSDPHPVISTPNQKLLENMFLRQAQKSTLSNINAFRDDALAQQFSTLLSKASSCDNLDESVEPSSVLTKPKSETDLTANTNENNGTRNELSGLIHLEEEPEEKEGMFNRFRKSFSLRFSRNPPTNRTEVTRASFDSSTPVKVKECEVEHPIDINQNNIFEHNAELEPSFANGNGKVSTIERNRRARNDLYTKKSGTLRRSLRRSGRLRRSQSQPNENKMFQETTERGGSLDADSDSPSGRTKSNSDTEDDNPENSEVIFAEAIFDFIGSDNEELSFKAGDLVEVTDTSHEEWWWGSIKTNQEEPRFGWFPASFVRLKVSQEETIEEAMNDSSVESSPSKKQLRMSMSKLSSEQVRANVVLEIINTERDFVKNLKDVIDGYLKPSRDRSEMFDDARICTIFGNIEELYEFQKSFLAELEQCINWDNLSQSQIGNCFLNNEKGFAVYCEFCKNHQLAISELQDLYTQPRYVVFFEGCRLLQNMIGISLDGFLLTPIQKICKYPLQLGELLKHTRTDHADYEPISNAHTCMQRVAQMVNERKRRFESLEQLITLQESFENWQGPPLLDSCSLLIHSGELTRLTGSSWPKDLNLFLFDHLLILCKKDTRILKKSTYIFRSRIELDLVESVVSLEDNSKDANLNVVVKNAFKFYYEPKQKWYLFQAKTAADKERWLASFHEERQRVHEDLQQGFVVSERDKRGARIAHHNNSKPKKPKSRRPHGGKAKKPDTVIAEIPLGPSGFEIDRNRAGSLPSYMHHDLRQLSNLKARQSTMHSKKSRSNWFQLGSNKKKNRLKRTLK